MQLLQLNDYFPLTSQFLLTMAVLHLQGSYNNADFLT